MKGVTLSFSSVISVVSLFVSATVAWLTLFRRGNLYMTRPVQIAFVLENDKPKVFLRTLLYATGKRGYVVEALYVKVRCREENRTFGFWGYGERNELMAAGGLRIDEAGVAYNHHFLEINEASRFHFMRGEYEIRVYATIVNRSSARLLYKANVTLSEDHSAMLNIRSHDVLFTFDPDKKEYRPSVSKHPRLPTY